eukprot:6046632-Alexandrium_andersonii.AAC.1
MFPELVVPDVNLTDEAAQRASEIRPGASEYYLGGQRPCVAVCRDTGWATADESGGGHYRRPARAERGRP